MLKKEKNRNSKINKEKNIKKTRIYHKNAKYNEITYFINKVSKKVKERFYGK